jgi:hypothetical protein
MRIMSLSDLENRANEEWEKWLEYRRIGSASYDPEINVICLHVYPNDDWYEIDLDRCKTASQLADWIAQLSGKNWCRGSLMTDFILCLQHAIKERYGKSLHSYFKVGGAA